MKTYNKEDKPVITKLGPFNAGYNNIDDEVDLPQGTVRSAENVDFDRKGWFRRRPGYNLIYSGNKIHSLWENYFVESGTLKFLTAQNTTVDIVSGLTNKRLDYCEANGMVYFSNEDDIGTIDGTMGIDNPIYTPILTASDGGLAQGTYQVSVAFTNNSGEQGGATNPVLIEVGLNGGIQIDNIPQSAEGNSAIIFMSSPNGEELYAQVVLDPGITSYKVIIFKEQGKLLDTQFMKRIPAGQFILQFKGRMYVAQDNILWYSEAQRPHLYSPASGFFNFKDRISVLLETEDGIYVVADKTYFLSGVDPKQMQLSIVSKSTGIEGTGVLVDANVFNLEVNSKVAYWFGSEGAILGLPNGQVKYLTNDKIAPVQAERGCTGYREINGLRQMISNLNERGEENKLGATDIASAVVLRNGIPI